MKNRSSDITRTICNAALALMTFAALSGCAAIGNPDGGPFDETPPRIIGSSPMNGATDVKSRKVHIDFDEFIKIENAVEKVVVSPPQNEQPEIKVIGKRIQVELFDSLQPNTTYSIDFSDGIIDNNEGNPLGDYCFRFSTGSNLDSMEVSGYVLNAEDLEPIKGITVGLHSDLSDSAFMTKKLERVSRTDASGHFTIRGLAPGSYRVYAISDMDQSFRYSQRNQTIAWMDSVIVPYKEIRYRADSLFTSNGEFDTIANVQYTQYLPNDIVLLAFKPNPTQQYITAAERPTHERFQIRFAIPLDTMPEVKGINFDDSDAYILQHSEHYDTLTFWMKDSTVYYNDTLKISINYYETDTLGQLVPTLDTIKLVTKESHAQVLKARAQKEEEDKKELDKKLRRLERSKDTLAINNLLKPKKEFLKYKLKAGAGLKIHDIITLDFEEPVTITSDTAFHLYVKADTVWNPVEYEIEHDTLDILRYRIYGLWEPGKTFKITVDSASIQGLYGLHNDAIEQELRFSPLNQFSTFTVNVANPKPGYTVRLHDKSGKIVKAGKLQNGSIDFFLLTPSTYYVSMYDDANNNGKWDTGEYEQKQQAERVWYIRREWQLRQDWTHETELWNVNELPLNEQKPDQLLSQKTRNSKANAHQRNIERLESKRSQIEAEKKKKERKRNERLERKLKNKEKYRAIRAKAKAAKSKTADNAPDVEEVTTPEE